MTRRTTHGSLFLIAHGRSGDKGDLVNIGVIARREEWYEFLVRELSPARVKDHLAPLGIGVVERYELPNLGALNFLVHDALGGGGSLTLKLDAQGKAFAHALFRLPLEFPEHLFDEIRSHWNGRVPPELLLGGSDEDAR